MKNQKGFTLLEMVIVLAIISVLAAAAYPRIAGYMENNREQYRQNQEYLINKTLMQYYAFTGNYCKVDCGGSGAVDAANAAILFNELKNKTGVTINGAGDYLYFNDSGLPGTDIEIRKIKVQLLP